MTALIGPVIPRLRRYARSMLNEREAADDLVQECLERAVRRWHQRRPGGDARPWLFAILHNLAMNRFRQASRRGVHVAFDDLGEHCLTGAPTQEDGLHKEDVLGALGRLPEEQRAVVLLVTVEELSYAETAQALDIPLGTVMSRLSRARAQLRRRLNDDETGQTSLRLVR